jgi:hypothetical protein
MHAANPGTPPKWARPYLLISGGLVVAGAMTAVLRLPAPSATVWLEASLVSCTTLLLVAASWHFSRRANVPHQLSALRWGLGTGAILGLLWIAEIAFNNLTPHSISTASARGVLDNTTWAIVGVITVVAAAHVAVAIGDWSVAVHAGIWSGVGSGLGAGAGGALLLALARHSVEHDPLMLAEWRDRAPTIDLPNYVTQETMAGVGLHIWALGIVQGTLLGILAALPASVVLAVRRHRLAVLDPGPGRANRAPTE